MLSFMRTPDARFQELPDYPFAPHYVTVDGLRMHYLDEGAPTADPILMLHGEPTWSYLYRQMIPICAAAGHRVIAPDLIGFGKSDKPNHINDYSYQSHLDWLQNLLDQLDLKQITLVCQDWGSLLGLRLLTANPDRFKAVVIGNGMLPTGQHKVPLAFHLWKNFALYTPILPIGRIIQAGTQRTLSRAERLAYDAPFPNAIYQAGARAFPRLVPTKPNQPEAVANQQAWQVLERWDKPFLTVFSSGDPITRGGDRYLQKRVAGAKNQPHQTLKGGHFLQEDSAVPFAEAINQLLASIDG